MKYIFLTFSMGGLTGNPTYVNNKVRWLKNQGVETVVFDHYGGLHKGDDIVLEYLLPYRYNRLLELFFPPCYFNERQRESIINKMCSIIGVADDYVVESNSSRLALWGETLASQLHAKHLILNIGESVKISNSKEFAFMNFKMQRNELFVIKPRVLQFMFDGYKDINYEEAQAHSFTASMSVVPEDIPTSCLENVPEADYKILSFGRYKPYFENMLNGVMEFAQVHKSKRINFLIMGDVELPNKFIKQMDSINNLFYKFIPAMRPVPKSVFDYSDVVIATAGCANIAYKQGVKTISMDAETCLPMGVMGYTTTDSVFSTNNNQSIFDVCGLLEEILIDHLYDGEILMKRKPIGKGFAFQLGLINDDRKYWAEVESIPLDKSFVKRLLETVVLRCGCVRLFAR